MAKKVQQNPLLEKISHFLAYFFMRGGFLVYLIWGYFLGAAMFVWIKIIYWRKDSNINFDDFHIKSPSLDIIVQLLSPYLIKYTHSLLDCSMSSLLAKSCYAWLVWIAFSQPAGEHWLAMIWLSSAYLMSLTDLYDFSIHGEILYPSLLLVALLHLFTAQPFYWHNLLILLPLFFFVWQEQLGDGDVFLLIGWAPWLTLEQLLWLLIIASCCGLLLFLLHALIFKKRLLQLPFVPCLSLALVIVRFL
jgi:Flp pilus assembly protein protease CpaA